MATMSNVARSTLTVVLVAGCNWPPLEEGAESLDPEENEKTGPRQAEPTTDPLENDPSWISGHALEDPGAQALEPVTEAVAVLEPTRGNDVSGTVRFFAKKDEKLQVVADVQGLPEGRHAYHLHLYGDCSSPDAKSAGSRFNLDGSSKSPPEDVERITGNLGELSAGADGKAHAETTLDRATLSGRFGILARSVVVHGKGNDEGAPPIGAAGSRLACGVVGVADGAAGT